ncbi:hypothetical protein EHQ81_19025 [Leptospira selangorensis]|uniref:Uncharacterized protein n=1 Tax=Leptospira selangorensis TaxID=2484982 RepID=A0A5F2C4M6_9LEPT|nr:hypothetical protein [Leptospira selangorensis]TGM10606.1 hypothetical protein EHQ81_19025 [Leptospira selangorensis]TGM26075.1 hypothetical protein EHQ82_04655 [Leptospira selangorensis]
MYQIRKFAKIILFLFFSCSIIFHTIIISGAVPFSIVWGGRLETWEQMIVFESISILLNSVFLIVIALDSKYIKLPIPRRVVRIAIWIMAVIFSLNTIGNIFSLNSTETAVFTPVTLVIAVCCIILASSEER